MMKLGLFGAACVITLMLDIGIVTRTAGKTAQNEQTQADLTNFQSYLEAHKPGKKWQIGPARIDSEEIRRAYENLRFYYVFSSPPTPPGAALPELLEEYELKLDKYQKEFISLTVRIDAQGRITPHYEVDYNMGMMRVTTDEDAKICAAAILSLHSSDNVGPGVISAKEITVAKSENGWSCSVDRENEFQGEVYFDKDGKCTSVTKTYTGTPPP
jgi:hypothetical protein